MVSVADQFRHRRGGIWQKPSFRFPAAEITSSIYRVTALDRIALILIATFSFLVCAIAFCAYFAIGDAPSGRLWSALASWTAVAFVVSVAGPWVLCRALLAAFFACRILWRTSGHAGLFRNPTNGVLLGQ